ncbi:MAG: antitoxin [Rhizomicrobium sp.]|jgi:plasmid stability protein
MTKPISIRRIPDAVYRRLKGQAARAHLSLEDFLIRELRKIAEQPTRAEMTERLNTLKEKQGE